MKTIQLSLFIIGTLVSSMSFMPSLTSNSPSNEEERFFVEASVGDINFRVEGEEKCFAYDFGDQEIAIYGAVNPDDLQNTEMVVAGFNDEMKVGEYPLISDNKIAKYMVYYSNNEKRFTSFSEQGGTLTITQVDKESITGSFEYSGIDNRTDEVVPVKGSFNVKLITI